MRGFPSIALAATILVLSFDGLLSIPTPESLVPDFFVTVTFLYRAPSRNMTTTEKKFYQNTFQTAWNDAVYDTEASYTYASLALTKVNLTVSNYLPNITPDNGNRRRLGGEGGGAHCNKNHGCNCPPPTPAPDTNNRRQLRGSDRTSFLRRLFQSRRRLSAFNTAFCGSVQESELAYFLPVHECETFFCMDDKCEEKLALEYADVYLLAPELSWIYGPITTEVHGEIFNGTSHRRLRERKYGGLNPYFEV